VLKVKRPKGFNVPDDIVKINEGDIFVGWSDDWHKIGRYFDLWVGDPHKENDVDNIVPFGKISGVTTRYDGKVFVTKFYKVLIQERKNGHSRATH
jgi:hypothetical protein